MYEKQPCIIKKCPNNGRRTVPYCAVCSAAFGRWGKREPQAITDYQDRLEKWRDRIIWVGGHTKRRGIKNAVKRIKRWKA